MLKISPLPHQQSMIEFGKREKFFLNRSPMGLGKTFATLATLLPECFFIVIVCPAYLVPNWIREIRKFTWARPIVHTQIESWGFGGILVVSYERFVKLENKLLKKTQAIVIDESHYLANPKSGRSKRVLNFIKYQGDRLQYMTFLTGTPVKQRALDLFLTLRILSYFRDHSLYHEYTTSWKFSNDFENCEVKKLRVRGRQIETKKFTGVKAEKKTYLRDLLRCWSVKGKLPIDIPLQRQYIHVDVPRYIDVEISTYFTNPSTPTIKRNSAISKTDYTIQFALEYIANYGCVVIFSDYPLVCEALQAGLQKSGVKAGMIVGDTPTKARDSLIQSFTAGKIDAIIGSIGAMSTGCNLQRANVVLFNDCNYNYVNNIQAEGRVTRIGQDRPCFAVYLVREGIDERVTELVTTKKVVVEEMA